jgi:hypothetical protein
MNDWSNITTAIATALSALFLALTFYFQSIKSLKVKIFVDQWISVFLRCHDPHCRNIHLQFDCTIQASGSTSQFKELFICKTEVCPPSKRIVEASANNHIEQRKFFSSHTPIIIKGGMQIQCLINYKPELYELAEGWYSIKVRMRDSKNKYFESRLIEFWLTQENLMQVSKSGKNFITIASKSIEKDLS